MSAEFCWFCLHAFRAVTPGNALGQLADHLGAEHQRNLADNTIKKRRRERAVKEGRAVA